MKVLEDHCYCCDLPCINCERLYVEVIYCDNCKDSTEEMYSYNNRELCYACTKDAILQDYLYSEKLEDQITVINTIVSSDFIIKIGDNKYVIDKDFSYEYSLKEALNEAIDYINSDIDLEELIERFGADCFLISLNY